MSLFDPKVASTISEYVEMLKQVADPTGIRWYRGHGDVAWKLVPTLVRAPNRPELEQALTKRFKQNACAVMADPPRDDWHWMFLMQHHALPTRLLDWSENPLVALYFAVANEKHDSVDGAVWCLDPVGLNTAAWVQSTIAGELPFFGIDQDLSTYTTDGLERTAKATKPPVAALAPRYFPRLAAQAGVFTVIHRDQTPLDQIHDGKHVGLVSIPKASKPELRKDLIAMGISRLTLFPELDSVAAHAKEVLR